MEASRVDKALLPREAVALLSEWLPRAAGIFGCRLACAALHGSVALGDFHPGWSDIDLCIVLDGSFTDREVVWLGDLHAEIMERFVREHAGGWRSGQAVEGTVISMETAGEAGRPGRSIAMGSHGPAVQDVDPLAPFDRLSLASRGIPVAGRPVFFAPPTRERLADQTRGDLASWLVPNEGQRNSPVWLAGMIHWMARSLVFWRDGVLLSKSAALEREMASGSTFAPAFDLAHRVRRGGSAAAGEHFRALEDQYHRIVEPAGKSLAGILDRGVR